MKISRTNTANRHTSALAQELAKLTGPCVQCSECDGLCYALIDALVVPDIILSKQPREAQ
jgi:hypothetical protein